MPGYSPLPRIELDPRNEAELVKAAARRVYEASNSTLNDFSAGSPIMALLEGQAFAQSEFLQFANQFPESVLTEWIGPFLGAQRRTGAGSTVYIEFTIDPRDQPFEVFEGYQMVTDSNLTNGEAFKFVTTERLTIPAGESSGRVKAVSLERGTKNNVPKNTIVKTLTSLAGVKSINNPEPATGAQDVELMSDVKERFFSLIRRRNPVSTEDWQDFFTDALGPGTTCIVRSRQSEHDAYRYGSDYTVSNPSVSFYILNPDGTPLTTAQRDALQTLIKWSLPTEFLGYVYSMEVDEVDLDVSLDYDPSKPYAQNMPALSQTVRNNLFTVMTPNAVFPVAYSPSVNDLENALTASFPPTLGVTNRFADPNVKEVHAYFTPQNLSVSSFPTQRALPFESGDRVKEDDLVMDYEQFSATFRATQDFNPTSNNKAYHVNTGDLEITIIKELVAGEFQTGDVITRGDQVLYNVINDFDYAGVGDTASLIQRGFISNAVEPVPFEGFLTPYDENGNYNPDLLLFDQDDTANVVAFPSTPTTTDKHYRPGSPIYRVAQPFSVVASVTSVGSAKTAGFVEQEETIVRLLEDGHMYAEGDYVKTPNPAELLSGEITKDTCYLNTVEGGIQIYAKVLKTFKFDLNGTNYTDATQALIDDLTLKQVSAVPFVDCRGVSTFAARPFRYLARFAVGEYVRYREKGGFDAGELEACVKQSNECDEISGPCRYLLELNQPLPRYFLVLRDFTPESQNIQEIIDSGAIVEVDKSTFETDYVGYLEMKTKPFSSAITESIIKTGAIETEDDLVAGQTVHLMSPINEDRGIFEWRGDLWQLLMPATPKWRDLFRFAPGDVAGFRQVSSTRNYIATQHVTPLMDLDVYVESGVFEETQSTENVKWVDPFYRLEDVIYYNVNGAKSFYRAVRSFTAPEQRTVWNETVVDTNPRIEEYFDNTLKIVEEASCFSRLKTRLPNFISALKLGRCQLNLTSKSVGSQNETYVWENTEYAEIAAVLSHSPRTVFARKMIKYGNGTVAL